MITLFAAVGAMLSAACVPALAQTSTATTLAVSSGGSAVTTVPAGSVVSLVAQVRAGSSSLTRGQVKFCDASAAACTDVHLLGVAQLTGTGTATLKFRPGLGTHSYKAVFAGTKTDAASSSAASALAVTGTPYPLGSTTAIAETGSWGNYAVTATVTEYGGTAAPTGNVSFKDTSNGNTALATASLGAATAGIYFPAPLALSLPTNSPSAEAVGDFNGDGIADLVVNAGGPEQPLEIFLGNANGTYTSVAGPSIFTYSFRPIVVADFNGDGKQDMAVLNANSSVVTILLGNGDGTFTIAGSSPASGMNPNQLAVGDFNGDGLPDLAVTDGGTNSVSILLGNGDGTFTAASASPSAGSTPYWIATGDFNGDGKLDLAVTDTYDDTVSILLGNGDGTFAAATTLHSGSKGSPIAVADFNGDGRLDLAVAVAGTNGASDGVTILAGNGDGTFVAPPAGTPASTNSLTSLYVGDFNADGVADLVMTDSSSGTFTVFLGSGAGAFTANSVSLSTTSSNQLSSAVGDLNGDGRTDLLVGISGGNGQVYLTQPSETATATANVAPVAVGSHLVDANYAGDNHYNASTSGAIPLWGQLPATGTSLTVTSKGAAVTSVPAGTAVTLTAKVLVGANAATNGQVNFCDASASACSDIHLLATAQLTSAGTATYTFVPSPGTYSYKAEFVQDGFGLASSSAAAGLSVGPAPSVVYSDAVTISNGGYPGNYSLTGMVVGFGGSAAPTGTISFVDASFFNASLASAPLGAATAGLGLLTSSITVSSGSPYSQVVGDFNGDGIPDLAIISGDQYVPFQAPFTISVELGNGDGSFRAGPTFTPSGLQQYPLLIAGDFNHDGKTDLGVLSYDGYSTSYITTFPGNGDGSFGAPQTGVAYNQGPVGGDDVPGSVVAADFNGDGKLDLAVVGDYASSGGLTVLLGKGDGTFTAEPQIATNLNFGAVVTGDFNGDGIPDLVAFGYFTGGNTVFLGNGDGSFRIASSSAGIENFVRSAVVGDFNGDGKQDFVAGYPGGVEVYLGNGDGTFQPGPSGSISGSGQDLVAGDFNHDGVLDLAADGGPNGAMQLFLGAGNGNFTVVVPTLQPSVQYTGPMGLVSADFNHDGYSDLALLQNFVGNSSVMLTQPTETASATVNGIAPVGAGNHLVDASYGGDSNYPASVSPTISLPAGVALPVISPSSGTFSAAQSVTITDPTPGAAIFYQVSGAFYTNGFIPYTGPIPLEGSGSITIEAYATETGYDQSGNASATFVLNFPAAATPVLSVAAGSYAGAQSVSIAESSAGATIYYTTNGTVPTNASNVYSGPISVAASEVLVARAIGAGYSWSKSASAQYDIASSSSSFLYTVAGSGTPGYSGDGGPATQAQVYDLQGMTVDGSGNLYFSDLENNVVRKVTAATGIISTFAGTGVAGHTGDSGPAVSAELWEPQAIAVDGSGDVFVAEFGDGVVRRIDGKTGTITTFAGSPTGTGSLGGPATSYPLSDIAALACDAAGNLYIANAASVLEVNASTGNITQRGGSGNGVSWGYLTGVAVDGNQNIYVSDGSYGVVREISAAGNVTVFAGGARIPGGDGGPATQAGFNGLEGVATDKAGNVYIADGNDGVIRVVGTNGIIRTVVGAFSYPPAEDSSPLSGDGVPATSAVLPALQSIAVDHSGNIYFSDQTAYSIRVATASTAPPTALAAQPVFSLAGGSYPASQTLTITDATPGAAIYLTLDGTTPTTASQLYRGPITITGTAMIGALALSPGHLASAPVTATYTITTPPATVISTFAGSGVLGFQGAGGPATSAQIGWPEGIAEDSAGDLFIADSYNSVVWEVNASTGNIAVVAGTGTAGKGMPGGAATATQLAGPVGVAVDQGGNLYIADSFNQCVYMVSAKTRILTIVAGSGQPGVLGDGGAATSASLNDPQGLAFDAAGDLYIADLGDGRVRRIDAKTGIISTTAGSGVYNGPLGDGGPATSASMEPAGIALDKSGNLYISDQHSFRIRKVTAATGMISTIAGTGIGGNSGDGGLATAAALLPTLGLSFDAAGDLYFSADANTVRRIDAMTGIITTIAGTGYSGYSGDGGIPTMAGLEYPIGLAFDAAGSLYIADDGNSAVRKITTLTPAPAPKFSPAAGTYTGTQKLTLSDTAQGAALYYTTDGSAPTTASSVYSGTISISASETVNAIATAPGYTESAVATAVYVIRQPATPVITWANPASILYGTALSSTQLDATASVPGSFVYTPAAGTIPGIGNDTLSVVFTPTDTTDYTTAKASVTLTVVQPAPVVASLSPAFTNAGSGAFTLTASGSGFTSASVVEFGSTALATQFVSGTQLTAQVAASAVASVGTIAVTVQNTAPGGGTSNALQFSIATSGAAPPVFGVITASVTPGSSASYAVTLPAGATNVSAACLNLPAGAACSYSAANSSVTITTSANTPAGTYQIVIVFTETLPGAASGMIFLPILLLPLMLRRKQWAGRGLRFAACVLVLAAAAFVTNGCGGSGSGSGGGGGTTPQTHQVTSSASVTLTVQ